MIDACCTFLSDGFTPQSDTENLVDQVGTLDLVETEAEPAVKTMKEQLAHRTVVLRRGLALVHMLFILAAGIIINLVITNLVT